MICKVKFYLSLSVLCTIVVVFPPDYSLTLTEILKKASSDSPKQNELTKGKVKNVRQYSPMPKKDEIKFEKPVNELFPHAVLFGGYCGGSIISPTWIISAGHCDLNESKTFILAGTNNSKDGSGVIRYVKRKIIHPQYSTALLHPNSTQLSARFDFLLAELEKPLPLDNITMTACKLNENHNLAPRTNVAYAGFGTRYFRGPMSQYMHILKLELLSENECSILDEYNSQDMICVKACPSDGPSSWCHGDSGSGLVDENGMLVGIASWAEDDLIKCRKDGIVYASKIAEARDWIRKITHV